MKRKNIYKESIKKFGVDYQIEKTVEECAELILAIKHYQGERCEANDVVCEISDVFIVIEQMKIIFGRKNVDEAIDYKIERLKKRIE